jgi:hypothetical protein
VGWSVRLSLLSSKPCVSRAIDSLIQNGRCRAEEGKEKELGKARRISEVTGIQPRSLLLALNRIIVGA